LAYGRFNIVPWNIIKYNLLSGDSRGPELYGTEPWYFYFLNLLLNFNIVTPLALISLPALVLTYFVDTKRVGGVLLSTSTAEKEKDKELGKRSSPYTLLSIRLAPFYIWFILLTLQPHKEERFFFPAYPFLAFNAAVTIFLFRGYIETAFIGYTHSPYQASRTSIFRLTTLAIVFTSCAISLSRILAHSYYYHAPLEIAHKFEEQELVRVLNVSGILPPPLPPAPNKRRNSHDEEQTTRVDLSAIKTFNLTLCLGKEWYRFPGHFLVPDGVNVEFVKSEFDGMLPRHFVKSSNGSGFWFRDGTRVVPEDLNDLNEEDPRHYVCYYSNHSLMSLILILITGRRIHLPLPHRPRLSPPPIHEPEHARASLRDRYRDLVARTLCPVP
jgi:alpha-1,2-mannosyltransferase